MSPKACPVDPHALAQLAMEVVTDALYWINAQGTIVHVNQAACDQQRCDEEQLLDTSLFSMVAQLTSSSWGEAWRVLSFKSPEIHVTDISRTDGTTFPAEVVLKRTKTVAQELACVLVHDITNRRDVLQDLRVSESLKASVIHVAPDCIITADDTFRIVDLNPAAELVFGTCREDILGEKITDLLPSMNLHAPIEEGLERYLRTGECSEFSERHEVFATRQNGEIFPIELAVAAVTSKEDAIFIVYIRDITTRRIHEEALQTARDEAARASQFKSRFLASMSHEIRTPMTAIVGYADMLNNPTATSEQHSEWCGRVRHNAHYLLSLVNDVLDLSKIEAGEVEVRMQDVDLAAMLRALDLMIRPSAEERLLEFDIQFASPIPRLISSDGTLLKQIIVNLLTNAVKFTHTGRIELRVSAIPNPSLPTQASLVIECVDSGIGIAPEHAERLFTPFAQLHEQSLEWTKGTGLGLTISRMFARLMSGDITVHSIPDQGSTFQLTLPIDHSGEFHTPIVECTAPALATPEQTAPRLDSLRILVADDNVDNQRILGYLLEPSGAELATAENGADALEQIQFAYADGNPFDLVLMDMQMPLIDGYEATKQIRRDNLPCSIIAITAYAMAEDRDKCLRAGCDGYVSKPIDQGNLYNTIQTVIAKDSKQSTAVESIQETRQGFAAFPGFSELVTLFRESLHEKLDTIQLALASDNHQAIQVVAHQLKGTGQSYGFSQLTTVAGACESYFDRPPDPDDFDRVVQDLIVSIQDAMGSSRTD